jgi:hypothetical protein
LNSGDGILLDGSGQTFASGAGSTANLTAVNTINLKNLDFSSFAEWNIIGNSIILVNDIFSAEGIYNFGSHNGSVTINAQNPGGLSIYNCILGGVPITSTSQVTLSSGPGHAPGMYSYANGH